MKQFFKFTFASIVGFFISIFLLFVIFFLFSFALVSSIDTTESVSISNNSVLELELDYLVPERSSYEPIVSFSIMPSIDKTLGLNDITKLITYAKEDSKIEGIYLNLNNFEVGGLSKINTIRRALVDFKTSNKFIIAHGNTINEKAYFLASVADSIYLTPTGNLEFNGFGFELTFFKNILDKLEIETQIFQYGKFKSATEPYRLEKMSSENREQLSKYLNSVYSDYISNISSSTDIDENRLKDISDNLEITSAEAAVDLGFINQLLYNDQIDSLIQKKINSYSKIKYVKAEKYIYSIENLSPATTNRIAVIYAIGEIINSRGDEYSIGTENIIESIRKAKENKRIKAIVMRVNSPGGSPLTSDMIWREIELAANVKPFIVSMGDLAASGGYYISCSADKIVAEPTTLAGSIGVYGMIPNTNKFFNNKIGITFDRVETNKNSIISLASPLSPQQKYLFQKQVDDIYFDFVNRVSMGRNMTFEEVDEIAQGRIWSGIDAKKIGLVDTLGGLDLALSIAAENAGITEYKTVEYPTQKEAFEKIMDLFSSEIKNSINNVTFEQPLNQIHKLAEALKYTGIQARLPFEYVIY